MKSSSEIKKGIFEIYEITKELWNNYYLGKDLYSEFDIKDIKWLLYSLNKEIKNIESECE